MVNYQNLRVFAKIDLNALHKNLENIRGVHPNKTIILMLKANAYGHGAEKIAHTLKDKTDYFGVASIEEGIALRKAGISQTHIIIFSGFFSAEMTQKLIDFNLIPVIHSYYQYDLLSNYFKTNTAEIWFKVNTGMNRLGLSSEHFNQLYTLAIKHNKPISVLTHLAESEALDQSFTMLQLDRFNALIKNKKLKHISAFNSSAALLNLHETQTNTIRIGLALFGASSRKTNDLVCSLKPVMSLHSHIIAVYPIKKGDSVGYNRQFIAQQDTVIAVASIGYGDGYPLSSPNGTPVLINGKQYSLAGKVSMDLITINTGHNLSVKIGDIVTLFGEKGLGLDDIAQKTKTSSYNLITSISPRVERLYL